MKNYLDLVDHNEITNSRRTGSLLYFFTQVSYTFQENLYGTKATYKLMKDL